MKRYFPTLRTSQGSCTRPCTTSLLFAGWSCFGNAGCTNSALSRFFPEGGKDAAPSGSSSSGPPLTPPQNQRAPGRRCCGMKKGLKRDWFPTHTCEECEEEVLRFNLHDFIFFLIIIWCLLNALHRKPPPQEKLSYYLDFQQVADAASVIINTLFPPL